MKTVRFNKQALAILAACFIFLLCVVCYFSASSESHNAVVVGERARGHIAVRDVENRHLAEEKHAVIHAKTVGKIERVVSQEKVEILRPARVESKPPGEKTSTEPEETGVGKAPIQTSEGLEKLIGKIHYENKDEENGELNFENFKSIVAYQCDKLIQQLPFIFLRSSSDFTVTNVRHVKISLRRDTTHLFETCVIRKFLCS